MARAGVGGDAGVDDFGVGDQHHRAVPDAEEVLDMIFRITRDVQDFFLCLL